MPASGREVKLVDAHCPRCEWSLKVGRVGMINISVFEDGGIGGDRCEGIFVWQTKVTLKGKEDCCRIM